jgi:hypothetical protein
MPWPRPCLAPGRPAGFLGTLAAGRGGIPDLLGRERAVPTAPSPPSSPSSPSSQRPRRPHRPRRPRRHSARPGCRQCRVARASRRGGLTRGTPARTPIGRRGVGNSAMFDRPQKSVGRGPFRSRPLPPRSPRHRSPHDVMRGFVAVEAEPSAEIRAASRRHAARTVVPNRSLRRGDAVLISPWSWRATAESHRAPRRQRQRSAQGTLRTPSRRPNHLA